jgi:hypothetical protein
MYEFFFHFQVGVERVFRFTPPLPHLYPHFRGLILPLLGCEFNGDTYFTLFMLDVNCACPNMS